MFHFHKFIVNVLKKSAKTIFIKRCHKTANGEDVYLYYKTKWIITQGEEFAAKGGKSWVYLQSEGKSLIVKRI